MGVWQTGVPPEHWLELPSEHCPQEPFGWHAGVGPPHSLSPAHARHVFVVRLQIGVTPLHCTSDVHGTQVPVVVRHAGVAPVHRLSFVAEHCPHAPFG